MQLADWHDSDQHALACQLIAPQANAAELMLLFNPTEHAVWFSLDHENWRVVLDSSSRLKHHSTAHTSLSVAPCSVLVLKTGPINQETSS